MGQEVNLVCISRGGNPLASIVWYKNDVKVDYSFITSGRESRNTFTFKAEASDNNARFRCEASNPLSPSPMKAEITLTVHCKSNVILFLFLSSFPYPLLLHYSLKGETTCSLPPHCHSIHPLLLAGFLILFIHFFLSTAISNDT